MRTYQRGVREGTQDVYCGGEVEGGHGDGCLERFGGLDAEPVICIATSRGPGNGTTQVQAWRDVGACLFRPHPQIKASILRHSSSFAFMVLNFSVLFLCSIKCSGRQATSPLAAPPRAKRSSGRLAAAPSWASSASTRAETCSIRKSISWAREPLSPRAADHQDQLFICVHIWVARFHLNRGQFMRPVLRLQQLWRTLTASY